MPASRYRNSWAEVPENFPDGDSRARRNVLIAYDDVPAGQYALRTLGNADRQFEEFDKRYPSLWQFDLLEDPDWRALATAEALQADLLVISASGRSDLPGGLKTWLGTCLEQKKGTPTAVVALLGLGEHSDPPDSPRIQFLKSAAAAAGLEFLAPGVD